nr:hypothetical protein [Pseudomonadota bacterium]
LNENTRRHFALVPDVRALPVDDPTRPLELNLARGSCATVAAAGARVERQWAFREGGSGAPAVADAEAYHLCLFRRR